MPVDGWPLVIAVVGSEKMKTQIITFALTCSLLSCPACRQSNNTITVDPLSKTTRGAKAKTSISNDLPQYSAPVDLSLSWQPEETGHKPKEYTFFLDGKRVGDLDTLKRYLCTLPKDSHVHPWYNEGRPRQGGTPDFDRMGLAAFLKTNGVTFAEAKAR